MRVFQRLKLLEGRGGFFARDLLLFAHGVFFGEDEKDHGHGDQHDGVYPRGVFPAKGDHEERGGEVGDRCADVTRTKDAQRGALLFSGEPAGHISNADDEGAARKAKAQGSHQEHRVGVHRGEQPNRNCGNQHLQGQHDAAAELVCPDAQKNPAERAGEHGRCDQQAELGFRQAQILLDLHTDDRKDRPYSETYGECQSAKPQRSVLVRFRDPI